MVDAAADALIGRQFRPRARGPQFFDCFGLMLEIYRRCGVELADPFPRVGFDGPAFRAFRARFRAVARGDELEPLDVLQQKRPERHVSMVLPGEYALDTQRGGAAYRVHLENIYPFVTGVWRLK